MEAPNRNETARLVTLNPRDRMLVQIEERRSKNRLADADNKRRIKIAKKEEKKQSVLDANTRSFRELAKKHCGFTHYDIETLSDEEFGILDHIVSDKAKPWARVALIAYLCIPVFGWLALLMSEKSDFAGESYSYLKTKKMLITRYGMGTGYIANLKARMTS